MLLVPCCGPPEVLVPVEEALYPVTFPVDRLIIGDLFLAVGLGRDHRLDAVQG